MSILVYTLSQHMKLEKRGKSYVGLCPFHFEKTPSFHVNPESGFYHCFNCHASGNDAEFRRTLKLRRQMEDFGREHVIDPDEVFKDGRVL